MGGIWTSGEDAEVVQGFCLIGVIIYTYVQELPFYSTANWPSWHVWHCGKRTATLLFILCTHGVREPFPWRWLATYMATVVGVGLVYYGKEKEFLYSPEEPKKAAKKD